MPEGLRADLKALLEQMPEGLRADLKALLEQT
jgi:hypothetical protein